MWVADCIESIKRHYQRLSHCFLFFTLVFCVLFTLCGCAPSSTKESVQSTEVATSLYGNGASEVQRSTQVSQARRSQDDDPYSREAVALYLHEHGDLPSFYITKAEAEAMDWDVRNPGEYVIGGDRFGNREGKLPKEKGLQYHECDLRSGYGKTRGTERLVYSNRGDIYYTSDHSESFVLLYDADGEVRHE